MPRQMGILGKKQELAIAAMLESPTMQDAAKRVPVSYPTLMRWCTLPEFKAAYLDVKRRVLSQAMGNLIHRSARAIEALGEVCEDKEQPAAARVSAARAILEMAFRGFEIEDILPRLEALEAEAGRVMQAKPVGIPVLLSEEGRNGHST